MTESQNKVVDKIEKLLALAGSDNENEAKAAMMKAQELLAKHKIDKEQIGRREEEENPVIYLSAGPFKEEWTIMLSAVISDNFRCHSVSAYKNRETFRIRFYGYEEDAEICVNIFNYAIKVIRKRFMTLKAIYAEAGRNFEKNEKMNYVSGFCQGLEENFKEQKDQNEFLALALLVPKAVNDYVNALPGLEEQKEFDYERNRENYLLRRYGYVDGKSFQNAGDKERLTGVR